MKKVILPTLLGLLLFGSLFFFANRFSLEEKQNRNILLFFDNHNAL